MIAIIKIYEEDFAVKVLKSEKPVVVDFFAEWCAPCKMLTPILKELSEENTDFYFYKINVDENPQLAAVYGINAIPAIIIFKKGECIQKLIGYNSKQALQDLINKIR